MLVIDNFFSFRRMIFLSKQFLVVRVTCSGSAYAQDTSPMSQEGILMTQYFKIDIFFSIYLFVIINISYRSVGKVFCTMDGRGSMVHIHPSSAVNMFLDNKIFVLIGKEILTAIQFSSPLFMVVHWFCFSRLLSRKPN